MLVRAHELSVLSSDLYSAGQATRFRIGEPLPQFQGLHSVKGSPYGVIQQAAIHLMGGSIPRTELPAGLGGRLYVTGHSLGGALAALFATKFCLDTKTGEIGNVHAVTFGQPLVGDAVFARTMRSCLGITGPLPHVPGLGPPAMPEPDMRLPAALVPPEGRYVRVVNDNDLVCRAPVHFMDDATAFEHADGLGVVRLIDHAGVLQPALAQRPTRAGFCAIAQAAVHKLRVAWHRMQQGWTPPGSEARVAAAGGCQSFLRLLVRTVLTPIGALNDHIDYKLLLHEPADAPGGYWTFPPQDPAPDPPVQAPADPLPAPAAPADEQQSSLE